MLFVKRTRATLRSAEFGFFGVDRVDARADTRASGGSPSGPEPPSSAGSGSFPYGPAGSALAPSTHHSSRRYPTLRPSRSKAEQKSRLYRTLPWSVNLEWRIHDPGLGRSSPTATR